MKALNFILLCVLCYSLPTNSLEAANMKLTSPSFTDQEKIPSHFTCDGKNISPELNWEGVPAGTKSFALIVEDPDAPLPHRPWVHWVVFNIPAEITTLPEGTRDFPKLGYQGITSFDKEHYGGPCPPSGTHRYYFKLYALDTVLQLPPSAPKSYVEAAMRGHSLAEATLMGTYARH
jgi:Raf kinase inhibitor-like YbhB/YbcL family protein